MQPLRSTSRPPGVSELKVKSMYRYLADPSAAGEGGCGERHGRIRESKDLPQRHDSSMLPGFQHLFRF